MSPLATALGCAGWLVSGLAAAQPTGAPDLTPSADACVASFDSAQKLRSAAKLLDARRELRVCSRVECPRLVQPLCMGWLEQVEAAIPSIVITVKDEQGNDTTAAKVVLDGQLAAQRVGPSPLEVDPGEHVARFELGSASAKELRLVLVQGQKQRLVAVSFAPEPAAGATSQAGSGLLPLAYVGFVVGAAGLSLGAITGGLSLSKASTCRDVGCTTDEIDTGKSLAHASTAGFIIGGVGLVLGVVGLVVTEPAAAHAGDVSLAIGPGGFMLGGAF